jgi:hypothetical protein
MAYAWEVPTSGSGILATQALLMGGKIHAHLGPQESRDS